MSVTIYYLQKGDDHPSYLLHCQAIRRVVFVEGQGVPEAIDFDGQDGSCSHLLLFDKNIPVGTTRIRKTDKGMKLERIAVLPAYRKKGYGELLVKAALSKVTGTIYINAQVASLGFYEHLGFVREDKTTFLEAGIPHTVMLWPHDRGEAPLDTSIFPATVDSEDFDEDSTFLS